MGLGDRPGSCRRVLRWLVPVLGAALAAAVLTGSAAFASGGAGTSIGDAVQLTGSATGTLADANADDWYVVYPATVGGAIDVTVTDTTPASPSTGCHTVVAEVDDTDGHTLGAATLGSNQMQPLSVNAVGSDRYFVELSDGNCNPGAGATTRYQVQLTSGGGGTVPTPGSSSGSPGTDIGSAGPPLQGDSSVTGTLSDGSQHDFYVLDKAQDTGQATIRVEDTSVKTATCRTVVATLSDTDGDTVGAATLGGNEAHVFAIATGGRYFLELYDGNCNPGTGGPATYRVEPEPAAEFTNPPTPPTQAVEGGALRASATMLSGGIDYTGAIESASTPEWFSAQTDQPQFIVTVENTGHKSDVNADCTTIVVVLDDANGNTVGAATLGLDEGHTFAVTGPGTFYLQISDGNCNPGTTTPPPFEISLPPGRTVGTTTTTTTTPTTTTTTTPTTTTTTSSFCPLSRSARAALASAATCPPLPRAPLPVVLVTGLGDSHGGTQHGSNCAVAGSLAAMCAAMTTAGYDVFVPASNSDPKAGTVIVNSRGFDFNGRRLASYLAQTVGRPALIVGHSMGGIFGRIATSRYHADALGLFTIASPFDGSFGADLAVGATYFPCLEGAGCLAIHAAGLFAQQHFGAEALWDLTSTARSIDNRSIAPTGVPTWTFAGTGCDPYPQSPPSYLFPNDGIVGASSAYGALANLGPTNKLDSPAYHQGDLKNLFAGVCATAPIELADPVVFGMIRRAAQSLSGNAPTVAGIARARAAAATVIPLQTASVRHVRRATVAAGTGTTIVSRSRFTVTCAGRSTPALSALGGRAFGFPAGTLGCARATVTGRRRFTLGVASDGAHAVARITATGRRLRITVTAGRRIRRLVLLHGKRRLRLPQHRRGARKIVFTPTRAQASALTLAATIQGHVYRATIPPLS